jgi:hypothetical protein
MATRFGWYSLVVGGRFQGKCAPAVVVVLTPLVVGWVVGTAEGVVATGVGATVGVGILNVVVACVVVMVGTAVATTGARCWVAP